MRFYLSIGLMAAFIVYSFSLFIASRRPRENQTERVNSELFFVFVVPCLNEELVIAATIERLLRVRGKNFAILIVDDDSDDQTRAIVERYLGSRVWLLSRRRPDARVGKGAALNSAYQHLLNDETLQQGELWARRPEDIILVVMDADGRLERNAITEVAPYFTEPRVGAVQIGVRMYNLRAGLLARMQDFEFVTFTEIYQKARSRVGTSGLGGNGQFTRLSALLGLGDEPWSNCLTEDLELGLGMLATGWTNAFCSSTWVSQQAVTSVRRLLRQRSRWFQGHLQCWKRIKDLGAIRAPSRSIAGLVHHLLSPALVLLISGPVVIFFASLVTFGITDPAFLGHLATDDDGIVLIVWYVLSFATAYTFALAYRRHVRGVSLVRAIVYAHMFVFYNYIWFAAGWMAMWRVVRRHGGWAKTTRSVDSASPALPGTTSTEATVRPYDQLLEA